MMHITDDGCAESAVLHTVGIDVRWGDLDADGHVNNTTMLRYVEEARMQWATALALETAAPDLMSVVANMTCTYLMPVGYPASLTVSTRCGHLGNSSTGLLFDINDAANADICYAAASITWVWVGRKDKRPRPMPARLREICAAAFPF